MKPWEGKQLWIWELPNCCKGDISAIVTKAKDLGLDGLIVKAWDAYHYWPQFDKIVDVAHNAGLLVGAWGYSHGQFIPEEVMAMERALHAGADWFALDCEIEYEVPNGKALATQLLDAVFQSRIKDATIGVTSFGLPNLHPLFPYDVFAKRCHVLMPQVYWGDFQQDPVKALQESVDSLTHLGKPIAPVGQAYGKVTPEQIAAFGAAAKGMGVSFWSWQHATDPMFEAIKGI